MKTWPILSLLILAGCSRGEPPVRAQAAAPALLAVARGVVDSEAGLIRVRAPRDGVVARSLVEEGEPVRGGQVLLGQGKGGGGRVPFSSSFGGRDSVPNRCFGIRLRAPQRDDIGPGWKCLRRLFA